MVSRTISLMGVRVQISPRPLEVLAEWWNLADTRRLERRARKGVQVQVLSRPLNAQVMEQADIGR